MFPYKEAEKFEKLWLPSWELPENNFECYRDVYYQKKKKVTKKLAKIDKASVLHFWLNGLLGRQIMKFLSNASTLSFKTEKLESRIKLIMICPLLKITIWRVEGHK